MIICCNAFLRVGLDLQSPIYEEKRDQLYTLIRPMVPGKILEAQEILRGIAGNLSCLRPFEVSETLQGFYPRLGFRSCIFMVLNRCIFCYMFCWYWYYIIIIVIVSVIIITVYHIGHIVSIWKLFRYMSVFVRYWWVQIWVVFCRDWECIGLDSSAWTGGCCYIDSCLPSGNMSHWARPWSSMSA